MSRVLLLRAALLWLPVLAAAGLWAWRRPEPRAAAAALLATTWALPALLAVHVVADAAGWWTFQTAGAPALAGIPLEAYFGWALLWGAVPALLPPRVPTVIVVVAAVWLDLLAMPQLAPMLALGQGWLAGEVLAVALVLVPALLLARWTVSGAHLPARALLQAGAFGGLTLGVATAAMLQATGGSWAPLTAGGRWRTAGAVAAVALLAVPAAAALREFAIRGAGTPFPYDPPRRLVTTGPYAYVANPLQVSMTAALVVWGAALHSWPVVAFAVMGTVFANGFATWHEEAQLRDRFPGWRAYRREVRAWIPRLQPFHPAGTPPAVLWVAGGCDPCATLGGWVARRAPASLELRPAEEHHEPLRRLRYEGPDGYRADGVAALARALEHLHLGWALPGWLLGLPVVAGLAQLVADVAGAGPRDLPARDDGARRV